MSIVTPDDKAAIVAINSFLTARGLGPDTVSMETILPSMEDVFISLIEQVDREKHSEVTQQ